MLRQDPLRKKRCELNLKSRFLTQEKLNAFREPEKVQNTAEIVSPSRLRQDTQNAVLEPVQNKNTGGTVPQRLNNDAGLVIDDLQQAVEANETALRCLRRIQQDLTPGNSFRSRNEEQINEVRAVFRSMPAFQAFQEQQEKEQRLLQLRMLRDSTFSETQPLLLFPRPVPIVSGENHFPATVPPAVFTNYYVWYEGNGIAVNPCGSFFDDFYRLGGTLADIQLIMFTKPLRTSAQFLKNVFEPYYRKTKPERPVTVCVPAAELDGFKKMFDAPPVLPIQVEPDLYNSAVKSLNITVQNDAAQQAKVILFQFGDTGSLQLVDAVGTDKTLPPELPVQKATVTVFAVQTPDDLYWAASQAKRSTSSLALFDDSALITPPLATCLSTYLGNTARWVPIDSSLVCDVPKHRFLDAVKAFDSDSDCWSDFSTISFAGDSPAERYYFAQSGQDRFAAERQEILESFRYHLHRRKGLYFA